MKIGSLVIYCEQDKFNKEYIGVIRSIEEIFPQGVFYYEVVFVDGDVSWFTDDQLEVLCE